MINMSALQNRIILQSGIHPQCPELFAKKLIFGRLCLGRPILPGTASDGTIATRGVLFPGFGYPPRPAVHL